MKPSRLRLETLEDRTLPATLTVTNLSDGDPGSLRAELAQAQAGDVIDFAPNVRGTITLTSGELTVSQSVSILGPGAGQLTVSGGGASRVFEVSQGVDVFMSGLTVTGGRLAPTGTNRDGGAGIANHGTLTVVGLTVTGNTIAGSSNSLGVGAGIANAGNLTVSGSSLVNNSAGGDSGLGGALANVGGTTVVTGSTIAGNSANGIGGGFGGGVYNHGGTLILTDCTITGNSSARPGGGGGGVYIASGSAVLTDCTVTNNSAAQGAGVHNEGVLTLTDSTLSGNHSSFSGSVGGGLDNELAGTAELTDCTIAANVITALGGAGGGVYNFRGLLTLTGCTVADNSSGGSLADGGGGLVSSDQGSVRLLNTIVADNQSGAGPVDAAGTVISLGHNLAGVTDGSSGWGDSDLTGTAAAPLDPRLGNLGAHGGPTATIPLLAGSPALDAGDPGLLGTPDQRGVVRGGGVNIGAFQATATLLVLTAPAVVTAGTPFDVSVTAQDPYGQVAVGYTGAVELNATDPSAGYLGSHTFTLADGGTFTFSGVTLVTAGPQTLSATDGTITGSFDLIVDPGFLS